MSTMDKSAGKKWPWIIGLSTVAVIALGVGTVKIAINNPVEPSDYGMQGYHSYDDHVNDIITSKIAFDKAYTITFLTPKIEEKQSVIAYHITDKEGKGVDNATVKVVLTRPDTTKFDINLSNPTVSDGKYTFPPVDLPKVGRWDILAKVSVGDKQRYYNLKADTRYTNTLEF